MNDGVQEKQVLVAQLREAFMTFMNVLLQMPGAPMQKQQGFLRFDEGHMWMQNAVMSYQPTVTVAPAIEPVPDSQPLAGQPPAAQPVDSIPQVNA
ncbi:MAG: hypothetical protein WA324_27655 [Bryobacteraceae bacterium]